MIHRIQYILAGLIFLFFACSSGNSEYTRGIGVYPGNPNEDYAPVLSVHNHIYHNLAFLKPVYQSGSYDYNLTAQLVTDGIKETSLPGWISTAASNEGILKKQSAMINGICGKKFLTHIKRPIEYLCHELQ